MSRGIGSDPETVEMGQIQEEDMASTDGKHCKSQNENDMDGDKEAATEQSSAVDFEENPMEQALSSELGLPVVESCSPR